MLATANPTYAHSHVGVQSGAKPKLYNPLHLERTTLYQTAASHFETWLGLSCTGQFSTARKAITLWRQDHSEARPHSSCEKMSPGVVPRSASLTRWQCS